MASTPESFHVHDFAQLSAREAYRWVIGAIVPRPIAFITTIDRNDVINLAPFSFFNGVSSDPPTLVFSIARKPDGSKKDTLLNIEEIGEFVVNSADEAMAAQINAASENFPHGVSELDKVGLDAIPSAWIRPPRVKQSSIHMECRLERIVEVSDHPQSGASLVIGRILGMHVADRVLENGLISYERLKPLARLGSQEWLRGGEIFRLLRP